VIASRSAEVPFPLTERAFAAFARRLGTSVGIKRAARVAS
jgi:hypothetical protein